MAEPETFITPAGDADPQFEELAALLTAGYVRLLAARSVVQADQIPLDSASESEAPLSERVPRRTKLA